MNKFYWHLLNGLMVRIKEDHVYLKIKKGDIGHIKSATEDGQLTVQFKGRQGTIGFIADEVERLK